MMSFWQKIGWGMGLIFIMFLAACQPDMAVSSPTSTLVRAATATAVPPTNTATSQPVPTASATATRIPSPAPILAAPYQSNGRAYSPIISSSGEVIAFTSTGNLTGNAAEQREAVFVRDVAAGTTKLINANLDGQAGRWPVYGMTMSGNGRVVAYYSFDGNLVPGDEMDCGIETDPVSCEDLFIYDRDTGSTERIPLGRGQGLGGDYTLALSNDGRFVAYSFHVYDRTTGQTTNIPTIDGQRPDGYTFAPRFAGDGRFLAFISGAANLAPNDTNEQFDVFAWDRETDQVERVSISSSGEEGNETSGALPFHEGIGNALSISGDGRFVAYASLATNLSEGVINECDDYRGFTRACYNIYLHDRQTGETQLLTHNSDGDSTDPALSGDGRYLAFASLATNLSDDVIPICGFSAIVNCGQIYLYDRQAGQISLISRNLVGEGGRRGSWQPAISADGRYITFASNAENLVAGDTNETSDIFRFDRQTGTMERVSLTS